MASLQPTLPHDNLDTYRTAPGVRQKHNQTQNSIWECCHCLLNERTLHLLRGKHPFGYMRCACAHTPCEHCHFVGVLKYFVPIREPLAIVAPESEKGEEIPYGIVCRKCGLSWRACATVRHKKENVVLEEKKTIISASKTKPGPKRFLTLLSSMSNGTRKRRSSFDFAPDFSAQRGNPDRTMAQSTAIKSINIQFSGLKCKCGSVSNVEETFCFHIVEGGNGGLEGNIRAQSPAYQDGSVLKIRDVEHPNPLRSHPV